MVNPDRNVSCAPLDSKQHIPFTRTATVLFKTVVKEGKVEKQQSLDSSEDPLLYGVADKLLKHIKS